MIQTRGWRWQLQQRGRAAQRQRLRQPHPHLAAPAALTSPLQLQLPVEVTHPDVSELGRQSQLSSRGSPFRRCKADEGEAPEPGLELLQELQTRATRQKEPP